MKRIVLCCIGCLTFAGLYAQNPNWQRSGKPNDPGITGKITGRVVDSLTQEPIGYATVYLTSPRMKGKEVNGNITEDNGKFKLENVKMGVYDLHIAFLGYSEKIIKGVELTPEKPDEKFDDIFLVTDNILLSEVEVVEEAPLVETKIDKIVYNAEKDVTNAGGDASDVLRKVPLLSVDLEGNVSLRGSQNIRILINGKPSGMFSGSVADALKMIPADQIKNVEVITSPSAKYDGEGSAGIINIITKKKQVQGFNGSVRTSVGTRQNNGNLSLNAAKGRLGFNANTGFWYSWPADGINIFERQEFDDQGLLFSTLNQSGITRNSRIGFYGRVGAVYDINAYHNITSSVNFRGHRFDRNGNIESFFTPDVRELLVEATGRNTDGNTLRSGYDWNTDYIRTFKDAPGREFSLSFQLNGDISEVKTDIARSGNIRNFNLLERQFNDGDNKEYTFQTDYVHPFNETVKLEIGAKSVLRRIDSDYTYEIFEEDIASYRIDPGRTNFFHYEQDVYAGYASFSFNLPNEIGIIAGARYENTDIKGDFESQINPFDNGYGNLLPSLIISKKLKQFQSIKLSYNQRIQRPSLFFINPYREDSDRRNVSFGNPKLDPETVHQLEAGYNTFVKGIVFNMAVYYRHTQDLIESILDVDEDGISFTTYDNIGTNNSIGANAFASATIKRIWTIRGNFDIYTYDAESTRPDLQLDNKGIMYNAFLSSSLNFKNGLKGEIFGFFRSPRRTLQGENPSFSMYSFGLEKELFKKRGSIGIRVVEPFQDNKKFTTELRGDDFYQFSEFEIPFRSFGINFNYTFGKLDFKAKSGRTKIRNNDLKGGEDNQGQQGGNFNND